jgi:hypothetical protein
MSSMEGFTETDQRWLLSDAMSELSNEENKCARLLAALTVTAGALAAGLFAGKWRPGSLSLLGATLWIAGAVALLAALGLVGLAVITQAERRRTPDETPTTMDGAGLAARIAHVQATVEAKRRLLTLGLASAGAGLALCLVVGLSS